MRYKLNSQIGGPTWGNYSLPEMQNQIKQLHTKKIRWFNNNF